MRKPMSTAVRAKGVRCLVLLLLLPLPSWASPVAEKGPNAPAGGNARAAILRSLGSSDIESFLAGMDADRLLLFEVRKTLPEQRSDAEMYLKRLKALAAMSDPVRLVPKVNRVIEQAPIYYDWLEKNIQNPEDKQNEYVMGGARGFLTAFQDFQSELMLTVINRLEIAETAIRQAAALSPG